MEHETKLYMESGVDGLILENMHDTPYCHARDLEPHITASMAVVAARVRELVTDQRVPVGVQGLDVLLTFTLTLLALLPDLLILSCFPVNSNTKNIHD